MNKNIELIALIYKSVDYLKMIHKELISEKNSTPGWDVNYRIIANDANVEVLDYLEKNDINFSIYNDPKPNDFYLNRVYRYDKLFRWLILIFFLFSNNNMIRHYN